MPFFAASEFFFACFSAASTTTYTARCSETHTTEHCVRLCVCWPRRLCSHTPEGRWGWWVDLLMCASAHPARFLGKQTDFDNIIRHTPQSVWPDLWTRDQARQQQACTERRLVRPLPPHRHRHRRHTVKTAAAAAIGTTHTHQHRSSHQGVASRQGGNPLLRGEAAGNKEKKKPRAHQQHGERASTTLAGQPKFGWQHRASHNSGKQAAASTTTQTGVCFLSHGGGRGASREKCARSPSGAPFAAAAAAHRCCWCGVGAVQAAQAAAPAHQRPTPAAPAVPRAGARSRPPAGPPR